MIELLKYLLLISISHLISVKHIVYNVFLNLVTNILWITNSKNLEKKSNCFTRKFLL